MHLRTRWIFALFAFFTFNHAFADDVANGHLSDLARFLDKTTPAEQRQSIFAAWQEAALKGDADAQYVVGSIYRRGDGTIARDADQARRLLSTAAAHGRLLAMAKMAELELAEDHPLDATIWAQIYGYYRGWAGTKDKPDYDAHPERQPSLYYEGLLQATAKSMTKKFGDQQTATVVQQVNAFIAAHDKDVRAQEWRYGISPRWAGVQPKRQPANRKSFHEANNGWTKHSVVAEWVLDFAPDGTARRALAFDALPAVKDGGLSHGVVLQYTTEPASGTAQRLMLWTEERIKGQKF